MLLGFSAFPIKTRFCNQLILKLIYKYDRNIIAKTILKKKHKCGGSILTVLQLTNKRGIVERKDIQINETELRFHKQTYTNIIKLFWTKVKT